MAMFTISDVAKEFTVSDKTVRRWITNKQINAIQLNGVYRISQSEVDRISSCGISSGANINLIRNKKSRIKKTGGVRPWEKQS